MTIHFPLVTRVSDINGQTTLFNNLLLLRVSQINVSFDTRFDFGGISPRKHQRGCIFASVLNNLGNVGGTNMG